MTSIINLTTAIPGPRSIAIMERRNKVIPQGVSTAFPVVMDQALGVALTDVDGNRFLDFAGGIGCLNAGSRHPRVQQAMAEQMDRLIHTSAQCLFNETYVQVAEKLAAYAPGKSPRKVFLVNSGSEAIENAVKIARKFTGRSAVIGFTNSFHGRTSTALALTERSVPLKSGFGPLTPEIYRARFPYPYRDGSTSAEDSAQRALDNLKRVVEVEIGVSHVAALVLEPIQGEGGFIVPPASYLPAVAKYCSDNGILLITDEIQAGMGRTGHLYASAAFGIEPDLIAVGKSLASGMPLAAVVGISEVMDSPPPGGLGGTYTGNPVACAAALATLDVLVSEGMVERASEIGAWIEKRTAGWVDTYSVVGEVRGLGAMQAIEFVENKQSRAPAMNICAAISNRCLQNGLLMLRAGTFGNVLRFLGPLTLTNDELTEGFDVLESAIKSVC